MAYFVKDYNPKWNYLFILLALFALPVTLFFMYQQQNIRLRAQQVTPIYVIANSQTVAPGDKLAIALQIKTDVAPVKEVQVNLSYPQEKLSSPNVSYSNSPFKVQTENIVGPGILHIGRNALIPVAGYGQIASLTFEVKDTITAKEISLAPGSYAISDQNKSLPVHLVIADSNYYAENKPEGKNFLDNFFDALINLRIAIMNSLSNSTN